MFNKYFWDVIKNHYLDFKGRATRKQYWLYVLWYVVIYFILSVIAFSFESVGLVLLALYILAVLLPSIGIAARRLRDGGFSPWWLLLGLPGVLVSIFGSILLNFLAFITSLVLLILYLFPSKK